MNNSGVKFNNTHPWLYGLIGFSLNFLIGFSIKEYVAEARFIPSGSMEPTLQINDRLVVEKVAYKFNLPKRGDIVVFKAPQKARLVMPNLESDSALVARVIGLPGEVVEIKNNAVFVNGKPLEENYINELTRYTWGPKTVPATAYIVLADDRNNSIDSHVWDFLPEKNIIGQAAFRFWPVSRIGKIE